MPVEINPCDVEPEFSVYGGRNSGKPAQFGPFKVRLIHDESPENPWTAWDCQTPLLAGKGRGGGWSEYDSGDGIACFFDHVSPDWVSRHWRAICAALDIDADAEDRDARESSKAGRYGLGLSETRRGRFAEYLSEAQHESRFFGFLATLYGMAGIPALSVTVSGYAQGDFCPILLVATRAHAERCGYDFDRPGFDVAESMEDDAELWRSYVFGDVFGYAVEDEHGNTLDSCSGFFGCYFDGDPGRGGYVLTQAADAVETAAKDRIDAAINAEFAARCDFLDLRREMKSAAHAVLSEGTTLARAGAICAALDARARDLLTRWKQARDTRRQCAALLA